MSGIKEHCAIRSQIATVVGNGSAALFKDIEHLVRLAVLFAIGLLAFVILRAAVVPRSFGQYGHYRGAAIAEIAARPIAFAGRGLANPATAMSRIRKSWASMWWWLARLATEHWPRTRMIQAPCNPRSSILRSCVPAVPRQTVRSPSGSRKWSRRITPEGSPATPAISPTAQRLKQKRV
jgi:hypothetical protein